MVVTTAGALRLLPKIERGLGTERARLGTFRGLGTERARLGTLKKNLKKCCLQWRHQFVWPNTQLKVVGNEMKL